MMGFAAFAAGDALPTQLNWVGPSYLAEPQVAPAMAPFFYKLWAEPNFRSDFVPRLQAGLSALQVSRPDLKVSVGSLATQGDDTYMLSMALVRENVDVEEVGDVRSIAYEIHAVVFVANLSKDPQRRRVVTSLPVSVRFIDVVPTQGAGRPDTAASLDVFRRMYLNTGGRMPDLISAWSDRARQIRLSEKSVWLRVHPLAFSDSAVSTLGQEKDAARGISARSTSLLEAGLSRALDIPVIPAANNGATGQAVLSLANLDARESFSVAEADYGVQVRVRELRQVSAVERTAGGGKREGNAYGAALVVALQKEPLDSGGRPEVLREVQLRRIDTVYHYGERRLDPAQAFARLIRTFHDELAMNLASPDASWIARARSDQESLSPAEIARTLADFSKRLK
jgi:hypothetical protein